MSAGSFRIKLNALSRASAALYTEGVLAIRHFTAPRERHSGPMMASSAVILIISAALLAGSRPGSGTPASFRAG